MDRLLFNNPHINGRSLYPKQTLLSNLSATSCHQTEFDHRDICRFSTKVGNIVIWNNRKLTQWDKCKCCVSVFVSSRNSVLYARDFCFILFDLIKTNPVIQNEYRKVVWEHFATTKTRLSHLNISKVCVCVCVNKINWWEKKVFVCVSGGWNGTAQIYHNEWWTYSMEKSNTTLRQFYNTRS